MKKLSSIFLIALTIYSCNNSTSKTLEDEDIEKEFFSNEFKRSIGEKNLEIINIDSISDFSNLRKEIGELTCKEKIPGLTFSLNNKRYNLIGYGKCDSTGEIKCKNASSLVYIQNDSIITDLIKNERIHISQLQNILLDIESDNYKYKITDNSQIPILINLDIDDEKPISVTKIVLKEIGENFDDFSADRTLNLNSYNIFFSEYVIGNISSSKP
jgi:hypothetical protein